MSIGSLLASSVLLLGFSAVAAAQQVLPPSTVPPSEQQVNVDRLPLDLSRIERQLRQSTQRENWDGFKLSYTVEVFGAAPKLRFFESKDVLPSGPIPYGAPTHKEMVDVMTPREFRAPAMDFASLMRWFEQKLK